MFPNAMSEDCEGVYLIFWLFINPRSPLPMLGMRVLAAVVKNVSLGGEAPLFQILIITPGTRIVPTSSPCAGED